MALSAGRVGVRRDQVDMYGKLKATDNLVDQIAEKLGIGYYTLTLKFTNSVGTSGKSGAYTVKVYSNSITGNAELMEEADITKDDATFDIVVKAPIVQGEAGVGLIVGDGTNDSHFKITVTSTAGATWTAASGKTYQGSFAITKDVEVPVAISYVSE